MKLESVKLDKQMNLQGQDSKCYSVEPVLRCLPGCMPVRTTTVNVGFHCVPAGESERKKKLSHATSIFLSWTVPNSFIISIFADSNLNRSEGLSSIFEKSIDLRETAEAHLACRCIAQCA